MYTLLRFASTCGIIFCHPSLYSYYIDKLASSGHFLFSSCGSMDEIVWTQTIWCKSCYGFWHSKWNLDWTPESEPWFQFCWFLSGKINSSEYSLLLHVQLLVLCHFSISQESVVSELMLYCLCIPDDKAGNHSLYCTLGDPFLQEEIQVNVETVFLWQCWYVDGHLHVYLIVITWPAVSLTYLAVIVILNWHGVACLRLGISKWVLKCMLAEFPDDNLHSHCF